MPTSIDQLTTVLVDAQRFGFLGDRPVSEVIEHARSFVDALEGVTGEVIDIGSGGGVPGLVVAYDRPDLSVALVDRRTRRTDFLRRAVARLDWTTRVRVIASDVDDLEETFAAVTARGFGPPTRTLEAAARLVERGGVIAISEPPAGEPDRWDPDLLARLGVDRTSVSSAAVVTFRRR